MRAKPPENFDKKIIMYCGSGGVGKTTIAAATAVRLACIGRKVIVMTIDPARRLMNSLGMQPRGNEIVPIDLSDLPEYVAGGSLEAFMMDPKQTMDELIAKFAPNEATMNAILNNKIYNVVADSFAGSQEYIALGKLYELYKEDYDHVVVDTAPTRYALEFFAAPTRLVDLLDSRIIKWFMTPVDVLQELGLKYLKRSSEYLFETIENKIGLKVISEVSNFVGLFDGMYEGFRNRAKIMHDLLRNSDITNFHVVCAPHEFSLKDGQYIYNRIIELEMPMGGMMLNRLHPDYKIEGDLEALLEKLETALLKWKTNEDSAIEVIENMLKNTREEKITAAIERENINELKHSLKKETKITRIPYFETDIATLEGLRKIGEFVF